MAITSVLASRWSCDGHVAGGGRYGAGRPDRPSRPRLLIGLL